MNNVTQATLYEDWERCAPWKKRLLIVRIGLALLVFAVLLAFIITFHEWASSGDELTKTAGSAEIISIAKTLFAGITIVLVINPFIGDYKVMTLLCAKWIEVNKIDYEKYFESPYNNKKKDYWSTEAAYMHTHKQEKKVKLIQFAICRVIDIVAYILLYFLALDFVKELVYGILHAGYEVQWPITKFVILVVLSLISSILNATRFHKTQILAWRQEIMQNKKEM